MTKILIVEDDRAISENLSVFLRGEGFAVSCAASKKEALEVIAETAFDIVLLDVSLPDGNGYSVCSAVKAQCDTPVIFVTASDDEYSVVAGLDMGADDYVSKPFRPRELLSRIKSVLRRSGRHGGIVMLSDVAVDTDRGTVTRGDDEVQLSALEYRLLLMLITNRGTVLSRTRILSELWDVGGDFVNENTLTVYIKRLRDKLGDSGTEPALIRTVRGIGYIID